MVADESKDAYYNSPKFNIDGFTIAKVEMAAGNAAAAVTIKAKITLLVPALGQTIHTDATQTTHWKLQNGEWVYIVDTPGVDTPFGKVNPQAGADKPAAASGRPDLATLLRAVQVDRDSVAIKPGENQTVKISNSLPGPVDIFMENFSLAGLSGTLDKRHLEQGETTSLHLVASDTASGSVTVVIDVSPLGTQLPIRVTVQ